jgi:hypothetical protein
MFCLKAKLIFLQIEEKHKERKCNSLTVNLQMVEEGKYVSAVLCMMCLLAHVNFYEDTIIINQPLEEEVMNA